MTNTRHVAWPDLRKATVSMIGILADGQELAAPCLPKISYFLHATNNRGRIELALCWLVEKQPSGIRRIKLGHVSFCDLRGRLFSRLDLRGCELRGFPPARSTGESRAIDRHPARVGARLSSREEFRGVRRDTG